MPGSTESGSLPQPHAVVEPFRMMMPEPGGLVPARQRLSSGLVTCGTVEESVKYTVPLVSVARVYIQGSPW